MELYAAIDLHSNNCVLAVIDESDRLVHRRRVNNDLVAILREFEPYRDSIKSVAIESTYNWYWLCDGLVDHGYDVRLTHAAAVPQYSGLKHGNDDSDAFHLAHLMRLGVLPEAHMCPRETRALRDLMRRRMLLVQESTKLRQSIQSMYSRLLGARLSAPEFNHLDDAGIAARIEDPSHRFAAQSLLAAYEALQLQVDELEKWAAKQLKPSEDWRRVRTTPGIGSILGSVILLETGPIQRFQSVGDYASYCRMVTSERWSNGKIKGHGNRKSGNRYLCWAFVEAANFAVRHDPHIKRWFDRKFSKRTLRAIAIKAVAHKLARAVFYMLRDGVDFDVKRAFG
jgi:transposase